MFKKILSVILVIIWMFVIFFYSSDNGEISRFKSEMIITKIVTTFSDVKKDSKEMKNIIKKYSLPLRKCAHFVEYSILALLVMNMLITFKINKYSIIISSIVCILYAISDEVHQLFVPDRSGQISDVLLDSSASLLINYLIYKFYLIRGNYEKKNN